MKCRVHLLELKYQVEAMDYICYKSRASRKHLEIKATTLCCFTANMLSVYMSSRVYFHQYTLGDQFQIFSQLIAFYGYKSGHRKQVVKGWQCHAKLASFPDVRNTVWAPGNETNANAKQNCFLWLCMIDIWTCLEHCEVQIFRETSHSISSHLIYDNKHISECLNFGLVLHTSCNYSAKMW